MDWDFDHTTGSHFVYKRKGSKTHLSIPGHREVREGTLRTLIAKMDLTVDEFLDLAKK